MHSIFVMLFCVIIGLAFGIYMLIKNNNTYNQRDKILYAEIEYCKRNEPCIGNIKELFELEDYKKTLFRIFDWSGKNIISKEGYKLIKEYIPRKERKNCKNECSD